MASRCSVCRHAALADIEQALIAGQSNRSVGRLYHIGEASIRRHRAHRPYLAAGVIGRRSIIDVPTQAVRLNRRLWKVLDRAEAQDDLELELLGASALASQLALLAATHPREA